MFDDNELLEVLSEVESIISSAVFDDIIWNGDLNFDPSRNSGFCRAVGAFLIKLGLVSLWDSCHVDYTHVHTDFKSTAVLDHFVVTERLVPLVTKCWAIHRGDNPSRHSPILLQLNVGDIPSKQADTTWLPRKPAWHKATGDSITKFGQELQSKLADISAPASLHCMDPLCSNQTHSKERDDMVVDILCAVVETSHTSIPLAGGRRPCPGSKDNTKQGNIAGWRSEIEPFRQQAELLHSMWRSSGKPNSGTMHMLMAKSRNQYHYAIRRTKRSAALQRAKVLLEKSLISDMDLLKEMKVIKCGKKLLLSFQTQLPILFQRALNHIKLYRSRAPPGSCFR